MYIFYFFNPIPLITRPPPFPLLFTFLPFYFLPFNRILFIFQKFVNIKKTNYFCKKINNKA